MSIATAINDLSARIESAFSACQAKGATMPAQHTTFNLSSTINSIPTGGSTDLTLKQFVTNTSPLTVDFSGVTEIPNYGAYYLCYGKTNIKEAILSDLESVGQYGCEQMFYGCTGLTSSIDLSKLKNVNIYSCNSMFYNCSGLSSVSDLPATRIGTYSYYSMFQGCSKLVSAPAISATNFNGPQACYKMFYGCTSLTSAPALTIEVLPSSAGSVFYWMFYGCSSLTSIPPIKIKLNDSDSANRSITASSFYQICRGSGVTSITFDCTECQYVPTLTNSNAFTMGNNKTGLAINYTIIVPAALYSTWTTTSNWSAIASHIVSA